MLLYVRLLIIICISGNEFLGLYLQLLTAIAYQITSFLGIF